MYLKQFDLILGNFGALNQNLKSKFPYHVRVFRYSAHHNIRIFNICSQYSSINKQPIVTIYMQSAIFKTYKLQPKHTLYRYTQKMLIYVCGWYKNTISMVFTSLQNRQQETNYGRPIYYGTTLKMLGRFALSLMNFASVSLEEPTVITHHTGIETTLIS